MGKHVGNDCSQMTSFDDVATARTNIIYLINTTCNEELVMDGKHVNICLLFILWSEGSFKYSSVDYIVRSYQHAQYYAIQPYFMAFIAVHLFWTVKKSMHLTFQRKMPIKSVEIKISKKKKIRFLLMSEGSLNPKIRFLGQKVCPAAHERTNGQTHRLTDTHERDYWGHPFRVSGVFPSTYHQGSAQYY